MKYGRTQRWLTMLGLAVLCNGCKDAPLPHYALVDAPPQVRPQTESIEPTATEPATLDDLLDIATQHHPDVRAARARVEIARGKMIQAGLHPNPSIGPNFGQLGDSANRMGEAGARFTQTFVTNGKLRIAKEAGARGVEAADWQAMTKWHDVLTRVRLAYFEMLTALREQATMNEIVGFSEKTLKSAETLEKNGAGNRPDVLRAGVELEQNRLKKEVAARRVESAQENLLTAIGRPALGLGRLRLNTKVLDERPPDFDWNLMLTCLRDSSTELQEARALIAQQEKLVAKAKADVCPNVTLTAIPFYESSMREMRAEVIAQVPVPIFDRNQGNIHAAKNEFALALAFERQLELRLVERMTGAYQRYQSARKQADAYRTVIVPKAEESLKLVESGYAAGDKKYDYTAVLQAQQVLAQARLAQTQAIGDLWRSVIEIAGLLQQDKLSEGCAVRERERHLPAAQLGAPMGL